MSSFLQVPQWVNILGRKNFADLLGSVSAGNSASISFDGLFNSALYDNYMILFDHIIPITVDVSFRMRVNIAGVSRSDAFYAYANSVISSPSSSTEAGTLDTSFPMSTNVVSAGNIRLNNTASSNCSGIVNINTAHFTSKYKLINWKTGHQSNAGDVVSESGSGMLTASTSALTGATFFMSSGNISTGSMYLYGIRKI